MQTKQTMISIWFKGKRYPFTVPAQVDHMGKAKVSYDVIEGLLDQVGVGPNDVFNIGA